MPAIIRMVWHTVACAAAALSIPALSHAEIAAEWWFNTPPTGTMFELYRVRGTPALASKQAIAVGGTYSTHDHTGLRPGWNSASYKFDEGSIRCAAGHFENASGLKTTGANSGYSDYLGFSGLGNGSYVDGPDAGYQKGSTIFLIVRPESNVGWNSTADNVHGLFGAGTGTGTTSGPGWIRLYQDRGRLTLQLGRNAIVPTIQLPSQLWDSSKWYLIAASWRDGKASLYCREMDANNGHRSPAAIQIETDIPLNNISSPSSEPLIIGACASSPGTATYDGADASIAYCRIDNVYRSPQSINVEVELLAKPDPRGVSLDRFTREDGTVESYYAAGSPYLEKAFSLMNGYWPSLSQNQLENVRGHLDNYLPPLLMRLDHNAAKLMMRRFMQGFFYLRHPSTKLIPDTHHNYQPSYLLSALSAFIDWFPNDAMLRVLVNDMATSARYYYHAAEEDGTPRGIYDYLDIETTLPSEPRYPLSETRADWVTAYATGMAFIGNFVGNQSYIDHATQKLTYLWATRRSAFPLLNEMYTPTGGFYFPNSSETELSDSDTLYAVMLMYQYYKLTGNATIRQYIEVISDQWYNHGWITPHDHFTRKMSFETGDYGFSNIYGDGDWTTLYPLVNMYRLTGNVAYLNRLKVAYDKFIAAGSAMYPGLPAGGINLGVGAGTSHGSLFMDVLLEAYEASSDPTFLTRAQALADATLAANADSILIREEGCFGGHGFLRLANDLTPVRRLEINFGTFGGSFQITRANAVVVEQTLPAGPSASQSAVIYLPQGQYRITCRLTGVEKSANVSLNGHIRLDWSSMPAEGLSINGRVFDDADGNTQLNLSESPLSGWTVFVDANGNGSCDQGEISTVTNAQGDYRLPTAASGTFVVRAVSQPGWRATYNVLSASVTVASNTSVVGCDFGQTRKGKTIEGSVFKDTNLNGAKDSADVGVAGVIAYLDANANGNKDPGEAMAMTDRAGFYRFENLSPGTYRIRFMSPAGWTSTCPIGASEYVRTVLAGDGVKSGNDFGGKFAVAISNSGFESPVIDQIVNLQPAYGIPYFNRFLYSWNLQLSANPAIAWKFEGNSGISGNDSGFTWGNQHAPEGGQVCFIQINNSTVSQTVSVPYTGAYTLALSAAQRGQWNQQLQTVEVYFDATLIGTLSPTASTYQQYLLPVTTSAGSHILKFKGTAPLDGTVFIDRVTLF